jgi:hypothetical protein
MLGRVSYGCERAVGEVVHLFPYQSALNCAIWADRYDIRNMIGGARVFLC